MARTYFSLADRGSLSPSGMLIGTLQKMLSEQNGMPAISIDGLFGRQTTTALETFQAAKGFAKTGSVTEETWLALTGSAPPPIFDRCLQVTASFEGTYFSRVVGNFDGAGITWGIIGFTLAGGELGSVLAEIETKAPGTLDTVFGHDADELRHVLHAVKSEQLAWADGISRGSQKYSVADPWRTYFSDLGNLPIVQQIQTDIARRKYWQIAVRDATSLDMSEELDLLLLFDVAVQNGGMLAKGRLQVAGDAIAAAKSPTAQEKRKIVATTVASTADPRWQQDVLVRKLGIATGRGVIHDGHYDLANWGFQDGAAAVPAQTPTA